MLSAPYLKTLTAIEKQMYMEKLKIEQFEHQHREAVYAAKRTELLEIETAYRVLQTRVKGTRDHDRNKITHQEVTVNNLDDQVNDFKRKRKQMAGAQRDLEDKINNMNHAIKARGQEAIDLQLVLQQ